MTKGTLALPRERKCILAALLTIWSIAMGRKSAYMISHTGRIPLIAAPLPTPTIAISLSGLLITLSVPNLFIKPFVVLWIPPYGSPISSPNRKILSLASISSVRVLLIAPVIVVLILFIILTSFL